MNVREQQQLLDAGYRRAGRLWVKPFGFTALVFDMERLEWRQVFRSLEDKSVHVYIAKVWPGEEDAPFGWWIAHMESAEARNDLAYQHSVEDTWHFHTEMLVPGVNV